MLSAQKLALEFLYTLVFCVLFVAFFFILPIHSTLPFQNMSWLTHSDFDVDAPCDFPQDYTPKIVEASTQLTLGCLSVKTHSQRLVLQNTTFKCVLCNSISFPFLVTLHTSKCKFVILTPFRYPWSPLKIGAETRALIFHSNIVQLCCCLKSKENQGSHLHFPMISLCSKSPWISKWKREQH